MPIKLPEALTEITAYGRIHKYSPIDESTIYSLINNLAVSREVKRLHAMEFKEAVHAFTALKQDTVLFVPSDIPRTKAVAHSKRNIYEKVSRTFLSNCIHLVKDKQGRSPRVLLGMRGDYTKLRTKTKQHLASLLYGWLMHNKHVKKVIILDSAIMSTLLPKSMRPRATSLKHTLFKRIFVDIGGVERSITVGPSPAQIDATEERSFVLLSEVVDFMDTTEQTLNIKGTVINSISELRSAIRRIDSYFRSKTYDAKYKLNKRYPLAIDLETSGLNPHYHNQHILSCQFSAGPEELTFGFFVDHPLVDVDGKEWLKELISHDSWVYVFQNGKFDLQWLKKFIGTVPKHLADTLLIDHYLHESYGSLSNTLKVGLLGMDMQIPRYLHVASHKHMLDADMDAIVPLNNTSWKPAKHMNDEDVIECIETVTKNFVERKSGAYMLIPSDHLIDYGMKDVYYTMQIYRKMIDRILEERAELPKVITHLHSRQMHVASEMEFNGFPIDYKRVLEEINKCDIIIEEEGATLDEALDGIMYTSDKELEKYMRSKYRDLSDLKNEDGEISFDSDHLMKYAEREPWVPHLIAYKKALKARNTYLIPFIQHSYKGIVYYELNLHGTATGRLSSRNPNFQNIPYTIKSGDITIYVKAVLYGGAKNIVVGDADLSSAEVKVLTVYVPDKSLIDAINAKKDLHCFASSIVHRVSYEESIEAKRLSDTPGVTLTERQKMLVKYRSMAKRATFGKIYGNTPFGFVKEIKFDRDTPYTERLKVAKEMLKKLEHEAYPELGKFLGTVLSKIERAGYAETKFGRRRRFFKTQIYVVHQFLKHYIQHTGSEIAEEAYKMRESFYTQKRPTRQFLNTLVQSTTSDYFQDMLYEFMIHAAKYGVKLVVTVHDSVVFLIPLEKGLGKKVYRLLDNIINTMPKTRYPELPVSIGFDCGFSDRYGLKNDEVAKIMMQ